MNSNPEIDRTPRHLAYPTSETWALEAAAFKEARSQGLA